MVYVEGLVTTGGCLCGAVRYESQGEPLAHLICHCRDCQRTSGTGGVPIMAVPKIDFRVTGETKSFAIEGGSGKRAIRHFCHAAAACSSGRPKWRPKLSQSTSVVSMIRAHLSRNMRNSHERSPRGAALQSPSTTRFPP
jgi:hypothetical protein